MATVRISATTYSALQQLMAQDMQQKIKLQGSAALLEIIRNKNSLGCSYDSVIVKLLDFYKQRHKSK